MRQSLLNGALPRNPGPLNLYINIRGQFEYFARPAGTIGRRWGPLDSLGHFWGPAEPCSDGPWVMRSMGVGRITHDGTHKAWVLRPRSWVKLGALWAMATRLNHNFAPRGSQRMPGLRPLQSPT
jgi:hypothetical protein